MSNTGLKVSASSLSRAGAGRASNPNTLARLQALDKDGGQDCFSSRLYEQRMLAIYRMWARACRFLISHPLHLILPF
jgi:hypothetical protein